jgi:hypothetical protein
MIKFEHELEDLKQEAEFAKLSGGVQSNGKNQRPIFKLEFYSRQKRIQNYLMKSVSVQKEQESPLDEVCREELVAGVRAALAKLLQQYPKWAPRVMKFFNNPKSMKNKERFSTLRFLRSHASEFAKYE